MHCSTELESIKYTDRQTEIQDSLFFGSCWSQKKQALWSSCKQLRQRNMELYISEFKLLELHTSTCNLHAGFYDTVFKYLLHFYFFLFLKASLSHCSEMGFIQDVCSNHSSDSTSQVISHILDKVKHLCWTELTLLIPSPNHWGFITFYSQHTSLNWVTVIKLNTFSSVLSNKLFLNTPLEGNFLKE